MISKKLLSQIVEGEVTTIGEIVNYSGMNMLDFQSYIHADPRENGVLVRVTLRHRLALEVIAYKCKEWAYRKNEWILESGLGYVNVFNRYSCSDDDPIKVFTSETESEAIFKACEWILEQESQNNVN